MSVYILSYNLKRCDRQLLVATYRQQLL